MASRKGIPNRKTQDLFETAAELDVDPFAVLCMFAKRDWQGLGYDKPTFTKVFADGGTMEVEVITPELQLSAAEKASSYLYPKRKAIDLKTHGGGLLDDLMSMPAEDRKQMIEAYAARLKLKKHGAD